MGVSNSSQPTSTPATMRVLTLRRFGYCLLLIYLFFTCYTTYTLLSRKWKNFFDGTNDYLKNSSNTHYAEKLRDLRFGPKPLAQPRENNNDILNGKVKNNYFDTPGRSAGTAALPSSASSQKDVVVEIWGKAAIGLFLWEHILKGSLEERLGGIWSYGSKKIGRFKFRFRTGAGVVPEKVPRDVDNVVLILNGREPGKQHFARVWLDFVADLIVNGGKNDNNNVDSTSPSTSLKNVGVVILGREDCDNDWLSPYLTRNGGVVKFAFIVYDTTLVDDVDVFQWPLGVATYRNFPRQCLTASADNEIIAKNVANRNINKNDENSQQHPERSERSRQRLPGAGARTARMYACNFLGTVYPNSTRERLLRVLRSSSPSIQRACLIKVRAEWTPGETDETLAQYVHALTQSDLTLNPAGRNVECYRHFEAMSCGSVPVLLNETGRDDIASLTIINNAESSASSKCDGRAPLRLFRHHGAPFIWLNKWEDVPNLIAEEAKMSQEVKLLRRQEVMRWYRDFLKAMRTKFVQVVEKKFGI